MITDTDRLDWILRKKTVPYSTDVPVWKNDTDSAPADCAISEFGTCKVWRIAGHLNNQYAWSAREAIDNAMEVELMEALTK